jgi:peptide/nickel transport system ATP-binding protein
MADRLALRGLQIRVGTRVLVTDVALTVEAGQIVALVGPSGSGKTLTGRALLGLVDLRPGVVSAELEVTVAGRTLRPYDGVLGASRRRRDRAFAAVRGDWVGYLPQGAADALDPLCTVGRQVGDAARLAGADPDPRPWLARAGFADADVPRVAEAWPHELSGGMAQRVVLAQTLARGSRFLVADEPTTGLDSPVRTRLLDELRHLADEGLGLLLITHDLRALPGRADRIQLVSDGRIIEELDPAHLWTTAPDTEVGRRLVGATRRVSVGGLR